MEIFIIIYILFLIVSSIIITRQNFLPKEITLNGDYPEYTKKLKSAIYINLFVLLLGGLLIYKSKNYLGFNLAFPHYSNDLFGGFVSITLLIFAGISVLISLIGIIMLMLTRKKMSTQELAKILVDSALISNNDDDDNEEEKYKQLKENIRLYSQDFHKYYKLNAIYRIINALVVSIVVIGYSSLIINYNENPSGFLVFISIYIFSLLFNFSKKKGKKHLEPNLSGFFAAIILQSVFVQLIMNLLSIVLTFFIERQLLGNIYDKDALLACMNDYVENADIDNED